MDKVTVLGKALISFEYKGEKREVEMPCTLLITNEETTETEEMVTREITAQIVELNGVPLPRARE